MGVFACMCHLVRVLLVLLCVCECIFSLLASGEYHCLEATFLLQTAASLPSFV